MGYNGDILGSITNTIILENDDKPVDGMGYLNFGYLNRHRLREKKNEMPPDGIPTREIVSQAVPSEVKLQ